MVIEMLWQVFTKRNFRVLMAAPYENQIRNMFMRINELIKESPLLKNEIVKNTKTPYMIQLKNGSAILGFTAGDDASSIRGQRADWIYIDELDFMNEYCFEVISSVAIERADIGITVSSTPSGKRSHFYKMCTDPKMGYSQHYHPSTHNPGWSIEMESQFRAQTTEQGYIHEVLAEFGTEEKGVYPKDKIDEASTFENYAYNELDYFQKNAVNEGLKEAPTMYLYSKDNPAPYNVFRTMGIDWDKFNASSSIIILDYDVKYKKFKVIKRVEVPRGEYSYDNAVNLIIELNEIYNPTWIYADAGSGEYQIERLHIYGDQHPETGLKNKLKRWQFSNTLEIIDPITGQKNKEPMKPFMVNQLTLSFERSRLMLSPWDETLAKQLLDYEVKKVSESGKPIYTSENEHFCDALGLAHLAFVLEFKELTDTIKDFETTSKMAFSNKSIGKAGMTAMLHDIQSSYSSNNQIPQKSSDELDRQRWFKVSPGYRSSTYRNNNNWGTRGSRSGGCVRSMW